MAHDTNALTGDGTHALVIGGSVAGLLAARVLADHFDRVTVLERDHFTLEPGPRKGVPQARHAHVLLTQGERLLEKLFPGIGAELELAGALPVDWTRDTLLLSSSGWGPRFESGLVSHACTRDLLEWTVRRRLAAHPRVAFVEGADVTGLVADAQGTGVAGVEVRYRAAAQDAEAGAGERPTRIFADFTADASGRTSRAPQWLEALAYSAPEETTINSFLGYASRWYEIPDGFAPGWQSVLISSRPPDNSRVGVVYPVEEHRWIVTLSGAARDYPPIDDDGFVEFARSLPSSVVYDAIKAARPISPIYGYQRTENRWRHYERLACWPERFVVLGDAVCAFNPVYGQGMSVGVLAALALDRCLAQRRGTTDGVARRFQRRLARTVSPIWLLATGADFRYPQTEGGRPGALTRFMHGYIDRVTAEGVHNPSIQQTFVEVTHLVKAPAALFRPGIVLPVLRRALRSPHRPAVVREPWALVGEGGRP